MILRARARARKSQAATELGASTRAGVMVAAVKRGEQSAQEQGVALEGAAVAKVMGRQVKTAAARRAARSPSRRHTRLKRLKVPRARPRAERSRPEALSGRAVILLVATAGRRTGGVRRGTGSGRGRCRVAGRRKWRPERRGCGRPWRWGPGGPRSFRRGAGRGGSADADTGEQD